MTPIETASLLASAVAILVGVPIAYFHGRVARELRHLRAHLFARHAAERHSFRAVGTKAHHRHE